MSAQTLNMKFLGKGWKYPFSFSERTGGVASSEELPHINESILQILFTVIGSRVMRRTFGSNIRSLVFSNNDPSFDAIIEQMLTSAIDKWEPRVIIDDFVIDRSRRQEGVLFINLNFTVIRTNTSGNLVFPYYLSEAEQQSWLVSRNVVGGV